MDYDPFGQRRNVENLDWLAAGAFQPKTTSRGFTGHDQIESMNLVHMKGRVYDPTIALFLTPDTYIQDPSMVQSLNRYSYVVNNPLRYNDPTGHFFTDHFFREVGRGIKSAGKALSNPGLYLEQTWNKFGRGVSDPRYLRLDGGDIGPHWDHTRKGEGKSGGRRIYPDGTVKPK
ncbi:MAG TPA: RHS repeat-associated core domain-containing protein [Oligoflexus sp.]|nr:RHS repeat-associated core domain-containing protein [Oligoflexus sp.]HYX32142.1 RHS repeat-associated core domain-containing protein [Oligoflexus sp.]